MKSLVAAGCLMCAVLLAGSGSADAQLQSLYISPFYPSIEFASMQHSEFAKGSAQDGYAVATYWDEWHSDYQIAGVTHPLRFGGTQAPIEMSNLLRADGSPKGGDIFAVNRNGVAVGNTVDPLVNYTLRVPTRWDVATGSVSALELPAGGLDGMAIDLNDAGDMVGSIRRVNSISIVQWREDGTLAGEFVTPSGYDGGLPLAINSRGQVLAGLYKSSGEFVCVRWDSLGGQPTVLQGLSPVIDTGPEVLTRMNDRGSVVSLSQRWLADESAPSMLQGLPRWSNPALRENAKAFAINNHDISIGISENPQNYFASRAVKWDSDDTNAIPLSVAELLVPHPEHHVFVFEADSSKAKAINNNGVIVGSVSGAYRFYSSGEIYELYAEEVAVAWLPDGRPVDLNTLIVPEPGWRLIRAMDISDTNWITGYAAYDPDGPMVGDGPLYYRMFLLQLPEPTFVLPLLTVLAFSRRRRHSIL
jgi:uncharacterized membrane protein